MSASPGPFPAAAVPDWTDVADQWFRAYRAGFDILLSLTNAALAGAERTQMAQLGAEVEAQTRNRQTALAMANVRDLDGLVALQSRLVQGYAESTLRYWSTCAELAQQTNAEIARIVTTRAADWQRLAQGGGIAPAELAQSAPAPRAKAA
jgi:phasin family protein